MPTQLGGTVASEIKENKMNRKIIIVMKCPSCGKVFVNNSNKHLFRPKYTPCCRVVYNRPQRYLPNLNWIKERISRLYWRQDNWKFKNRTKIERKMMLERQKKGNFEDITKEELDCGVENEYKVYKKSKEGEIY